MDKIQNRIFGQTIFDRRIYLFVIAIGLLFLFDLGAIYLSLYYVFEWIDIPVHVTGGFILALLFYYVAYANTVTCNFFKLPRNKHYIFSTMVFWVLVVAVSWEIVEFVLGRTVISPKLPLDTFTDILATVTGSLISYGIIKQWRIKKL